MIANPQCHESYDEQQQAPEPQVLTGARIFLKMLVELGVETVFGLPGGVVLSVYDALPEFPLEHVLVRHEQCAVHMAEGYARSTGKPGVVLVTSGPGATNTVTGIADAYYDSVPLVVFTGNVVSEQLGNDAFQEADIAGITRPCTKHNVVVRRVEDLAQAIKEAFHVATTGRPGPVLVDLPKDVLLATTEFRLEDAVIDLPGYAVEESYTQAQLAEVLELLKTARQPVLLSGGGVVSGGSHRQVLDFAERFQLPVACSLMGLGGFPADHPLFMGFCGMHGQYWANIAIANADLLIIAGNRLNERQTGKANRFARNAKIVHIDLDPSTLQRNVEAFLPVQGELRNVLDDLLSLSADVSPYQEGLETRGAWMDQIAQWKTRRPGETYPEGMLHPGLVIERIFAHMPADGFVTTEVGQHQMWAAQRFNLNRPRSFITSGGLGTMGFGFPAAIGVQVAHPNSTVVDIAGDGSFQMVLQELATARENNLPVKVCIINNSYLGMIRQWQDKMFERKSQARLMNPDYVKLAEAYDCVGFVVNHPDELDAVLEKAFAITDRPVLIDFHVQEQADVYPWVPAGASNDEMLLNEPKQSEEP